MSPMSGNTQSTSLDRTRDGATTLLSRSFCANTKRKDGSQHQACPISANQACGSCRLVQYCSKECQSMDWPHHKKVCKSDLMKHQYVPSWIKEGRCPHWVSDDDVVSKFGVDQYLWGNMPAVDILNIAGNEGVNNMHDHVRLLFAASGDIRNVVKTVAEGLPGAYDGGCTLVVNDLNFMVVARNAILLLIALSLEADEAAAIMLHVWYSALLPHGMVDTLRCGVLKLVTDVCDKIKDKKPFSLQAKTFSFGQSSLRLILKKHQWDDLKGYFGVPQGLTQQDAQQIRRRCMLAPERIDYLHRALCNQPAPFRVATVTFREDGLLLPHGAAREQFQAPNPTLFHNDLDWPMNDDASPLEGWDYYSYRLFTPKAGNDLIGGLFFYLQDLLSRFCERIKDANVHFVLYNVDARALPEYLSPAESRFDRIEISNICDRGYIGPAAALSTFGPLLSPSTVNPKATLLLLFLNAVSEEYYRLDSDHSRLDEAKHLIQRFIPMTPATMMSMMTGGMERMVTPEMVRLSSCYTMFGDFDKTFDAILEAIQIRKLARENGMKVKEKATIVKPWPLRITDQTTTEEFEIRCATSHTGSERYMEFATC